MAAFLDVCRYTPTAGSTTDWTYSAAATGYQSPTAAGVVNGRLYKYRAESADLSQWEVGEGAYNTGTGVLARATVLFNSAGTTSKINFSTVPQVAIVALKEDLISIEETNSFTAAQQLQARQNIGAAGLVSELSDVAWTAYTPSSAFVTPGTSVMATAIGRWKQIGKTIFFKIDATVTTVGTGTGAWTLGLPAASTATSTIVAGSGKEVATLGSLLAIQGATTTTITVLKYDNTSLAAGGNGTRVQLGGFYEAA